MNNNDINAAQMQNSPLAREVFGPTMNLRMYAENHHTKPRLQQEWHGHRGGVQWRDVPQVFEK